MNFKCFSNKIVSIFRIFIAYTLAVCALAAILVFILAPPNKHEDNNVAGTVTVDIDSNSIVIPLYESILISLGENWEYIAKVECLDETIIQVIYYDIGGSTYKYYGFCVLKNDITSQYMIISNTVTIIEKSNIVSINYQEIPIDKVIIFKNKDLLI